MSNDGIIFMRRRLGETYIALSNNAIRDVKLSLDAKGLYGMIQSYISSGESVTKEFLMEDCLEDAKFFEHIWHELERKGYLKTHIYPDGEGGFQCEYTLLEEADVDGGAYCYEHDADGVVIATNLGEKKHK